MVPWLAGACLLVSAAACGDNECDYPKATGVTGQIAIPETPHAQALASVDAGGHGGGDIGQIAIVVGVGTIEVRGVTMAAVVDAHGTDFPSRGDTLESVLVAGENDIELVYCHGGAMYHVFWESADGVHHGDSGASGTCSLATTSAASTALPPITIDYPALDRHVVEDGAMIQFDGVNPGTVMYRGTTQTLLPFAHVDCSGCGMGGWQEQHVLVWNEQTSELGVGIIYLTDPEQITLSSPVMILPSWSDADGVAFDAAWKICGL
jgi:hypothetical protein